MQRALTQQPQGTSQASFKFSSETNPMAPNQTLGGDTMIMLQDPKSYFYPSLNLGTTCQSSWASCSSSPKRHPRVRAVIHGGRKGLPPGTARV